MDIHIIHSHTMTDRITNGWTDRLARADRQTDIWTKAKTDKWLETKQSKRLGTRIIKLITSVIYGFP
jgi:hypothetical protein